jgi:transposase
MNGPPRRFGNRQNPNPKEARVHIVPRIDRAERRDLMRTARKANDLATMLRFYAVALLGGGKSSPTVADILDIAVSTVVRAAHAYLAHGIAGLHDRRRGNGRPKADGAFRARVAELLRRTPEDFGWRRPTWTRELLCRQTERDGQAAVSVSTMGRALARIGARLGMPKPTVCCPWKRDAREARLAEIRALEERASATEPVLYSDEVDIHLNPKIGRDWMLPGQQRRVITPGKNEKFYLAGALDVRTGELLTTGLAHKGAALFCELLRDLAAHYGPKVKCIHLIVDNYSIHAARATLRTLEELGGRIVLHHLPPYCPDANRIERVWQDLHANVTRNHRCRTMKTLLGKARDYLVRYLWRRATGAAPVIQMAAEQRAA